MSIEQGNQTPEGAEDLNESESPPTEQVGFVHEITPEGVIDHSHLYTPEAMAKHDAEREQWQKEHDERLEKEIQEIKANKEELTDPEAQQHLKDMRGLLLQIGREWSSLKGHWNIIHGLVINDPTQARLEVKMDELVEDMRELAEQITLAESGEDLLPEETLSTANDIVGQERSKDQRRSLKAKLEGTNPSTGKPLKEWYPDEYKKLEAEDL